MGEDALINITEHNWAFWLAGGFALFEFFKQSYGCVEWLCKTFGIETKSMRQKREWHERLSNTENAIKDIKETSKRNVEMFLDHERQVVEKFTGIKDEIIVELNKLHEKIDEQQEEMATTNKANMKTDRAMLRDRIAGGMRYFSQRKDDDGNVHISFSDYENMDALFREYFAKGGNGAFKKMYEDEFRQFIIDR